jgi:hypothetical protein
LTFVQFGFVAVFCFFFGFFAGDPQTHGNEDVILPTTNSSSTDIGQQRWGSIFSNLLPRIQQQGLPHAGIWRRVIPFTPLRQVLGLLFISLFWMLRLAARIIHRSLILFRYWVALGLGIHQQDSSSHRSHHSHARMFSGTRIRIPSRDVIMTMLPLSCFLISGHIFSSLAISYVPVSFVHSIKVRTAPISP